MEQWSPTQDVGNGKRDFKVIPPPRSAPTKRCNQTWRQLHLKSLKVAPAEWSTAQPGKGHSPQPQLQPRTDRIVPTFMGRSGRSRMSFSSYLEDSDWCKSKMDTGSERYCVRKGNSPPASSPQNSRSQKGSQAAPPPLPHLVASPAHRSFLNLSLLCHRKGAKAAPPRVPFFQDSKRPNLTPRAGGGVMSLAAWERLGSVWPCYQLSGMGSTRSLVSWSRCAGIAGSTRFGSSVGCILSPASLAGCLTSSCGGLGTDGAMGMARGRPPSDYAPPTTGALRLDMYPNHLLLRTRSTTSRSSHRCWTPRPSKSGFERPS